jgi:HSP20 family protein
MGSFEGFNFGGSLDDIMRMAREFGEKFKEMAPEMGPIFESCRGAASGFRPERPEHSGFYSYPPTNAYSSSDGSLVFEFALAGIEESAVSVAFQGDYLVLNAKSAAREAQGEDYRYSRRGFNPRDIERQKYRVPAEDYAQELAKAVFKNGVLTVTIPLKQSEGGIRIEIVKEGN